MTDADDTDVSLSGLQLELMRVLWLRDEATVAEIAEGLADTRELAHTTVATSTPPACDPHDGAASGRSPWLRHA